MTTAEDGVPGCDPPKLLPGTVRLTLAKAFGFRAMLTGVLRFRQVSGVLSEVEIGSSVVAALVVAVTAGIRKKGLDFLMTR